MTKGVHVALLVAFGVEGRARPPREPFLRWLAAWSALTGMTAVIPRLRRWAWLAWELYAISAITAPERLHVAAPSAPCDADRA